MDYKRKRWIHMAGAMFLALCSGIGYAWSVFQKPLMENSQWGLKSISLTFTLQILVSTIAPVFLGRVQKQLGIRNYIRLGIAVYVLGLAATMSTSSIGYFYIIYGIVVGIGIAILYPTLMSYATGMFPDKTGMASGMLACSYGSGAILWAPIATYLMKSHGVLSVFGFLALIFAAAMIPASFLIRSIPTDFNPSSKKSGLSSSGKAATRDYTWKEMLKTPRYYVILTTLTLGAASGLMIMGHASGMLQEILGFTPEKAAYLVGLFSVSNALGRLLFGLVSDRLGRYNIMMLLFAMIGGAMFILTRSSGIIFIASMCLISSCYGGFTSMFSPVCADNFGMKNLAVNYAFLYIAYGLAGAIGPQLAAGIKTVSGGYDMAFLTVAAMSTAGLLLVMALKNIKPSIKAGFIEKKPMRKTS